MYDLPDKNISEFIVRQYYQQTYMAEVKSAELA